MSVKQTNSDEFGYYVDNLLFNHDIELLSQFVRDMSFEKRKDFFNVIESHLSSTDFLLSKPEKLKSELNNLEIFLKENWPSIFASLNTLI